MHDIVIRGGTIIDGTGRTAFSGDVAVDGGCVAAIGGKAGPARREIAADGLLVTPGWVDVHTHYDGQATWDPILAPSSWHGVTTILFGNCGVGFAPVRPHHRDALIDLMEGVEDIPGPVLAEGLKWDWESFPDFLDALERMPRTIDVAAQVPHHPLRVYVMGDRAIRREPATAEDIAEMRRLTEEAVLAGAFGFTTSRTNAHKTTQGEMVPGRFAEIDELTGIGAGLGAARAGTFGMNSDFEDETAEFAWLTRLAKETGRPVWFLLTDRPTDPQRWRRIMAGVHQARAEGGSVTAQVAGRPVGVILGIATSLNPFAVREPIREMLTDPGTLLGLGDGGAHVAMIVDASAPTYMLTHWGRDRKRGPGLPLEYMVKRQTSETADFFGFHDRGRLEPGKRADINLIDFDRLRLHTPEVVNDLPAGGKRLVQGAEGYEATLVAGTPVFERGEHTGAKPGRLVRRGR